MLKPLSTRISQKTYAEFEKVCQLTHIPKSRLLEEGIAYVVGKYSDLDKKLELIRAIEEAEADVKAGRFYTLEDVDRMLERVSKKRQKHQ